MLANFGTSARLGERSRTGSLEDDQWLARPQAGRGGEAGDKPPEAPDSNPFYHTASDDLDANGDNHDPSNGSFATKGTGGGKKSLNDLKHTARRANLSPSGANSISVKGVCDKTRHDIQVNKHLKKEAAFAGISEDEYISEGGKTLRKSCWSKWDRRVYGCTWEHSPIQQKKELVCCW